MKKSSPFFKLSEKVLIFTGVAFIASTLLIWLTGDFSLWVFSKILYGVGVTLFLINK